jgi:DNA-binding NarL/FixJ family response regulator
MQKIRLMIIEDNRLLREGLADMLAMQPDMRVVSALGDRESTVAKISDVNPHVLLMDLGLRNQNSLRMVRAVRNSLPDTRVIVMDLVPTQEDVLEYVEAGVSGFLLKDATLGDFVETIRSIARGAMVLPPQMAGSLFSQIVNHAMTKSAPAALMESVRMTRRERQVVDLVADGYSNKEIAERLHLSPYTVKSHVHNILEKLSLHTRVQIARYMRSTKEAASLPGQISLLDE